MEFLNKNLLEERNVFLSLVFVLGFNLAGAFGPFHFTHGKGY